MLVGIAIAMSLGAAKGLHCSHVPGIRVLSTYLLFYSTVWINILAPTRSTLLIKRSPSLCTLNPVNNYVVSRAPGTSLALTPSVVYVQEEPRSTSPTDGVLC